MKKYISVLLIVVMASIGLAVRGSLSSDNSNNKKIKVVTTIFPEYDWGKEIAGTQIADNLAEADPEHKDMYSTNYAAFAGCSAEGMEMTIFTAGYRMQKYGKKISTKKFKKYIDTHNIL